MKPKTLVLKEKGKKKVKIVDDGYGLGLNITRNGSLWTEICFDHELIAMMKEAIDEYLESNKEKGKGDIKQAIARFPGIHEAIQRKANKNNLGLWINT